MKAAFFSGILVMALILAAPSRAHAAWWGWGGENDRQELDLEGYDANTVTTVSGRIKAVLHDDSSQAKIDVQTDQGRIVVVLGPRDYWAAHGFKLTVGEWVTVRGSKAQGRDGVVYLLSQKISADHGREVALRSASGQPAWSTGARVGFGSGMPGQMRQQAPTMRMGGGGRMGR